MENRVLGIIKTSDVVGNMKVDTFSVLNAAVEAIVEEVELPIETAHYIIDNMVDRTPNYLELSQQEQHEKIRNTLTCEKVIEYLRAKEMIESNVSMIDVQMSENEIILEVMYITETTETKQLFCASEEEERKLEAGLNIFSSRTDLIEAAKKKLEKLKKNGKITSLSAYKKKKGLK